MRWDGRALVWTRFLLPGAFTVGGVFLLIWSDHDSWPIGSLTFAQTFFGDDPEIIQHKIYGILACAVGTIEFLRRLGWFAHAAWTVPLPLFAIVGGVMLFNHSHGDHSCRLQDCAASCDHGDHGYYRWVIQAVVRLARTGTPE